MTFKKKGGLEWGLPMWKPPFSPLLNFSLFPLTIPSLSSFHFFSVISYGKSLFPSSFLLLSFLFFFLSFLTEGFSLSLLIVSRLGLDELPVSRCLVAARVVEVDSKGAEMEDPSSVVAQMLQWWRVAELCVHSGG